MKSRVIIAVVAVCSIFGVATVSGQNAEIFRQKLSEIDTLTGATVDIFEYGTAADAVASESHSQQKTVNGYRVRIFFDNSQTARQDAQAIMASFDEQFPEIKSYLAYENPAFIVTVGNCLTIEEALILQNQVKKKFKTAFIWRGDIPMQEFIVKLEPPKVEEPEEDAETIG